jgi:transposase-like protein
MNNNLLDTRRRRRDPARERAWRDLFQQFADSGQRVREFCAARGIKEPTFYFWRREIQHREGLTPVPKQHSTSRSTSHSTPHSTSHSTPRSTSRSTPRSTMPSPVSFAEVLVQPSTMTTAQAHGIDPQAYLRSVLAKMGQMPMSELNQFLPDVRKADVLSESSKRAPIAASQNDANE